MTVPSIGKTEPTIRRPLTIAAGLVILVALSAASFACGEVGGWGGMENMHQDMHGGGDRVPQTPVVSTESQVMVEIRDFDFFPRELTVKTGTAVTWVNRDAAPHDATDEAGGWGTGTLNQGESAILTFDSPGAYRYFCTIHPNMRANPDGGVARQSLTGTRTALDIAEERYARGDITREEFEQIKRDLAGS